MIFSILELSRNMSGREGMEPKFHNIKFLYYITLSKLLIMKVFQIPAFDLFITLNRWVLKY